MTPMMVISHGRSSVASMRTMTFVHTDRIAKLESTTEPYAGHSLLRLHVDRAMSMNQEQMIEWLSNLLYYVNGYHCTPVHAVQ